MMIRSVKLSSRKLFMLCGNTNPVMAMPISIRKKNNKHSCKDKDWYHRAKTTVRDQGLTE